MELGENYLHMFQSHLSPMPTPSSLAAVNSEWFDTDPGCPGNYRSNNFHNHSQQQIQCIWLECFHSRNWNIVSVNVHCIC